MRFKSIKKIPELLSKLNEEATKVIKELTVQLAEAQTVADAVLLEAGSGSLVIGSRGWALLTNRFKGLR